MKFTADAPSATNGTSAQDIDRSQGAARAISVSRVFRNNLGLLTRKVRRL